MSLRKFERRVERLVEGTFARVFRTSVRPVEVARRLSRELDMNRTVGVSGATMAPNHFEVSLSAADYDEFEGVKAALARELVLVVIDQAQKEGYEFLGPVHVQFVADAQRPTGSFGLESRMREGRPATGHGVLLLPGGGELVLGSQVVQIGRMADCAVVIDDPNTSRYHAEVHPDGDGWVLVDLGSTNGSRVNGRHIERHRLSHGDILGFGEAVVRYQSR